MEDSFKKNPKKRKISEQPPNDEELKDESTENHEPFSFYSLLNIEKNATIEEIVLFFSIQNINFTNFIQKKAYKTLALKFHPDKNPQSPEEARKNFQKVTEAYQILIDPEKKKIYDETGFFSQKNKILLFFQAQSTLIILMNSWMLISILEIYTRKSRKKIQKTLQTNIDFLIWRMKILLVFTMSKNSLI